MDETTWWTTWRRLDNTYSCYATSMNRENIRCQIVLKSNKMTKRFHERCSPDSCSPATFALEAQTKSQSTPNLNLCFALTHTYIHILIYALIFTRTCAYTLNYLRSKCRWGATVAGEHHSCYPFGQYLVISNRF